MIASAGVAIAVGAALSLGKSGGNEEVSAEQQEWEEQLKQGGGLEEPAGSKPPVKTSEPN